MTIVGTQRVTRSREHRPVPVHERPGGTYLVRVNRIGYTALGQQVTITAGSEATANFGLVAAAALEEVLVSATGVGTQTGKRQ